MRRYDVIIAGLGAMGSAALYHLAGRGVSVVGFDRYAPPHTLGSSHGETRMIREAYYEHPGYVHLVRRAYDLWHKLSEVSGHTLIEETGGIFAGPLDGELVPGILRSAREHHIPVQSLPPAAAAMRAPWLAFDAVMRIVSEPRAGLVYPERCITAHIEGARRGGATVQTGEPVESWRATADGVTVRTARGEYAADRLILTTGAWIVDVLADIGVHAVVERQPLLWFASRAGAPAPSTVWALEFEHGKLLYGFPAMDNRVKVAIHYGGAQQTTAEQVDRTFHPEDEQLLRRFADRYLPGVLGGLARGEVCMYTNTPDLHFIFDAHPQHDNVLVVSACSGHGFKFSSAIGEAAAQWAHDGRPQIDMSRFALSRLLR